MHHKLSYLVAQWIAGLYSVSEVDVLGQRECKMCFLRKSVKDFSLKVFQIQGLYRKTVDT